LAKVACWIDGTPFSSSICYGVEYGGKICVQSCKKKIT